MALAIFCELYAPMSCHSSSRGVSNHPSKLIITSSPFASLPSLGPRMLSSCSEARLRTPVNSGLLCCNFPSNATSGTLRTSANHFGVVHPCFINAFSVMYSPRIWLGEPALQLLEESDPVLLVLDEPLGASRHLGNHSRQQDGLVCRAFSLHSSNVSTVISLNKTYSYSLPRVQNTQFCQDVSVDVT